MKVSSLAFLLAAQVVSQGAIAQTANTKAPEWPIPGTVPIVNDDFNDMHPFVAGSLLVAYNGGAYEIDKDKKTKLVIEALKCEWTIGKDGHAQLGAYHQLSELNDQLQIQKQITFIDGKILVVRNASTDGYPIVLPVETEVLSAQGKPVAKDCKLDRSTNDFAQSCRVIPAFADEARVRASNDGIAKSCEALFTNTYAHYNGGKPLKDVVDAQDYKTPPYRNVQDERDFYSHVTLQFARLTK
jgi:hypothetical protein